MVAALTVLAGLATLGLVLYVLAGTREIWDLDRGAGRLARLKKRRERVLRTMKDLETEREAGVLHEEEFLELRASYKRQAIQLSRELDRARQTRLRHLSKGAGRITARTRDHVQSLVEAKKSASSALLVVCGLLVLGTTSPAAASVVVTARLFDAEASYPAFKRAAENRDFEKALSDELKVPFANREAQVQLVDLGDHAGGRGLILSTWEVMTDAAGAFVLDTGREAIPPRAVFVATASDDRSALFTRFFGTSDTSPSLMLYRTSDRQDSLQAVGEITYDYVTPSGGASMLRVQIVVELNYLDYTMYVGKRTKAGFREIFRVPLVEGATIIENRGPDEAAPGWVVTADRQSLIIDSPLPGLYDSLSTLKWEVTYDVPARQRLVQTFDLPFGFDAGRFTAWCVHEDMVLDSPQLRLVDTVPHQRAPVSSNRSFDVRYSREPIAAGSKVQLWLTVDNAAIGQVSAKAVKWVAGFLLSFLVAILAGLAFGRRTPSAEAMFGDLSGEEVLDRIVDLDQRFEAGTLREGEYRQYRAALVELAAEEFAELDPLERQGGEPARARALSAAALSKETRDILRRLDALEKKGLSDPGAITERAHLLEALAKSLPREGGSR